MFVLLLSSGQSDTCKLPGSAAVAEGERRRVLRRAQERPRLALIATTPTLSTRPGCAVIKESLTAWEVEREDAESSWLQSGE
jgi:hypothetical protein